MNKERTKRAYSPTCNTSYKTSSFHPINELIWNLFANELVYTLPIPAHHMCVVVNVTPFTKLTLDVKNTSTKWSSFIARWVCNYLLLFGTHEALHHLASFPSSRETISRPGIKPPTSSFNLGTSPLSSCSLGWTLSTSPYELWGVPDPGGGNLPGNKLTRPKIDAHPPDFQKNNFSCIFEGHSPTDPILSALHPPVQNPIYMCTSK